MALKEFQKHLIRLKKNMIDDVGISAKYRWPLDKNAPYMKGPGLKL